MLLSSLQKLAKVLCNKRKIYQYHPRQSKVYNGKPFTSNLICEQNGFFFIFFFQRFHFSWSQRDLLILRTKRFVALLSFFLSFFLSFVFLFLFLCQSIFLSLSFKIYLFLYLFVCLWLPQSLSVCLFFRSICLISTYFDFVFVFLLFYFLFYFSILCCWKLISHLYLSFFLFISLSLLVLIFSLSLLLINFFFLSLFKHSFV